MNYTDEDFERLYVRYKAECLPRNMSMKKLPVLRLDMDGQNRRLFSHNDRNLPYAGSVRHAISEKFFNEIARGNLNYGNLLPMTIGLPVNNC